MAFAQLPFPRHYLPLLQSSAAWRLLGVDMFFLISGHIITAFLARRERALALDDWHPLVVHTSPAWADTGIVGV
jgi:peptidoglycan/LPS O-acetylase OafA/YrhL